MKLFLLLIILISSSSVFAAELNNVYQVRASAGYAPYAHIKIKDRSKQFYFTGVKYDIAFTVAPTPTFHSGIYIDQYKLKNKQNTETDKENFEVLGAGFVGTLYAPIKIRPFFGFGFGYYIADIYRNNNGIKMQHYYKKGLGVKAHIGFSPKLRGIGWYVKAEGHYIMFQKGENTFNDREKLFQINLDSYSINFGVKIAI